MYQVDENFEFCLNSKSRYDELYGTIDLMSGNSVDIEMNMIVENSVTITWDSGDGKSDVTFGTCVCSELDMSIYTDFDRYALNNAVITLGYRVWDKQPEYDENNEVTNEAIHSDCPLGIFTAMEVTKDGKSNTAHILAYDNIKKLDVSVGNNVFSGKPWIILNDIHEKSQIGWDLTELDLSGYPNHEVPVQYDATTGAKTYRDIVRYTGQLMGTNFRAERLTGSLDVWQYGTSVTGTLFKRSRYDHTPSDYQCQFRGIEVTSVKGTYKSVVNSANGTIMYIDDAPAWDYGTDAGLKAQTLNLGNYVRQLAYTPCEATIYSDPRYECGDLITVVIDDDPTHDIRILVTGFTWKFRNKCSIKSIGTAPELGTGVISDSDRRASRATDANKLVTYDVSNTQAITLHDQETTTICDVSFTSAQKTNAMWLANILLESDSDSDDFTDVKVTYYYDNTEIEFYPQEHYTDGNHDFSLFFPISMVEEQSVHRWKVDITALGGDVTIDAHDFRGTLFGQNLVEQAEKWDGLLQLEDIIDYITTITIVSNVAENEINVMLMGELKTVITETLPSITSTIEQLLNLTETYNIEFRYREDICFCGENYYCGTEGVLL